MASVVQMAKVFFAFSFTINAVIKPSYTSSAISTAFLTSEIGETLWYSPPIIALRLALALLEEFPVLLLLVITSIAIIWPIPATLTRRSARQALSLYLVSICSEWTFCSTSGSIEEWCIA